MVSYDAIIGFWFEEIEMSQWWHKDAGFDVQILERFGALHKQATQCELFGWREDPKGRLAEIILLDQFSRNIYRDTPAAFASDSQALTLAQEAVRVGADSELSDVEKSFLYMPYMHSESLPIHEEVVKLFKDAGLASGYEFELKHKVIIERFGRYPHRNEILGRASTEEELAFLKEPGSSF